MNLVIHLPDLEDLATKKAVRYCHGDVDAKDVIAGSYAEIKEALAPLREALERLASQGLKAMKAKHATDLAFDLQREAGLEPVQSTFDLPAWLTGDIDPIPVYVDCGPVDEMPGDVEQLEADAAAGMRSREEVEADIAEAEAQVADEPPAEAVDPLTELDDPEEWEEAEAALPPQQRSISDHPKPGKVKGDGYEDLDGVG